MSKWIASLVLYVELRVRFLALELKEGALHLLVLAALLVSALRTFFDGFPCDAHRFSSVPADDDLPLGMGLERRGVARCQYH